MRKARDDNLKQGILKDDKPLKDVKQRCGTVRFTF